MNKEKFWQKFLDQELAVFIETQEQYDAFMQYCYFKGLRWVTGSIVVDHRVIGKEGIYISGTREKPYPNVLNFFINGDWGLDNLQKIPLDNVFDKLFQDEISDIESKLGYPMGFIFNSIIGHPVYQYDPEVDMMWDLKAEGITKKGNQYIVNTKLDGYPLNKLGKTWFLEEWEAFKCKEIH